MKYCIGCIHLYLQPHYAGKMGSEWTGRYGSEDAALLCMKDHWRQELEGDRPVPFGEHMARANTCADYQERAVDNGSAND